MNLAFEVPHAYAANRAPMDSDEQRCLKCGEEAAHAYHIATQTAPPDIQKAIEAALQQAQPKPVTQNEWKGDSPFWLMCQTPNDGNVGIDIDEPGWIETHKSLMRTPGTWFLMEKRRSRPLFSVVLEEGDQFYFAKRHVGNVITAREITAYGIGKKKADGTPVNLWLMPNGVVCGGNDVDLIGARML